MAPICVMSIELGSKPNGHARRSGAGRVVVVVVRGEAERHVAAHRRTPAGRVLRQDGRHERGHVVHGNHGGARVTSRGGNQRYACGERPPHPAYGVPRAPGTARARRGDGRAARGAGPHPGAQPSASSPPPQARGDGRRGARGRRRLVGPRAVRGAPRGGRVAARRKRAPRRAGATIVVTGAAGVIGRPCSAPALEPAVARIIAIDVRRGDPAMRRRATPPPPTTGTPRRRGRPHPRDLAHRRRPRPRPGPAARRGRRRGAPRRRLVARRRPCRALGAQRARHPDRGDRGGCCGCDARRDRHDRGRSTARSPTTRRRCPRTRRCVRRAEGILADLLEMERVAAGCPPRAPGPRGHRRAAGCPGRSRRRHPRHPPLRGTAPALHQGHRRRRGSSATSRTSPRRSSRRRSARSRARSPSGSDGYLEQRPRRGDLGHEAGRGAGLARLRHGRAAAPGRRHACSGERARLRHAPARRALDGAARRSAGVRRTTTRPTCARCSTEVRGEHSIAGRRIGRRDATVAGASAAGATVAVLGAARRSCVPPGGPADADDLRAGRRAAPGAATATGAVRVEPGGTAPQT